MKIHQVNFTTLTQTHYLDFSGGMPDSRKSPEMPSSGASVIGRVGTRESRSQSASQSWSDGYESGCESEYSYYSPRVRCKSKSGLVNTHSAFPLDLSESAAPRRQLMFSQAQNKAVIDHRCKKIKKR